MFHADGQIDRQTDRQTDMTKLIIAFRNLANVSKSFWGRICRFLQSKVPSRIIFGGSISKAILNRI